MTYADDLRKLADFYDANPALPTPTGLLDVWLDGESVGKDLVRFSKALPKPLEKHANDYSYGFTARFGDGIELQVAAAREAVCTRREVGTKIIPARDEQVAPVYEWDCPKSLRALEVEA